MPVRHWFGSVSFDGPPARGSFLFCLRAGPMAERWGAAPGSAITGQSTGCHRYVRPGLRDGHDGSDSVPCGSVQAPAPDVAGPEIHAIIVIPAQAPAIIRARLGHAGIGEAQVDPAEYAAKQPAARGGTGLDPVQCPLPLGALVMGCILRKRGAVIGATNSLYGRRAVTMGRGGPERQNSSILMTPGTSFSAPIISGPTG